MSLGTDHHSNDGTAAVFKTFPEFSKLILADRQKYEKLIADYPSVSDFQFTSLMTWYVGYQLEAPSISTLNGNLILSYWLSGNEAHSGLSVVGTHAVDETICTICVSARSRCGS